MKTLFFGVVALSLTLSATAANAADGGADGKKSGLQQETERIAPRGADKISDGDQGRTPTDAGVDALADTVDAYQRVDPELTTAQAQAAAKGQDARKQLWEDVLADHVDAFGEPGSTHGRTRCTSTSPMQTSGRRLSRKPGRHA